MPNNVVLLPDVWVAAEGGVVMWYAYVVTFLIGIAAGAWLTERKGWHE